MKSQNGWVGSRFNYCFIWENNYLIYNTLQTSIFVVDAKVFHILLERFIFNKDHLDDRLIQTLAKERLIVCDTENEEKTVINAINRIIYDNKLDVTIIPTQGCNFRCVYCFEDHKNNCMSDESEDKIIKFFKRHTRDYRSIKISWFGGEPLLEKKRVLRIMENVNQISKEYGVPLISEIITNGYLLDYETFVNLVKNNVLFFEITLDGFAYTHDKLRPLIDGSGTFNQILKNLIEIQSKSKNRRFKIIIRTNLNKDNAPDYNTFVKSIGKILYNDERFEFLGGKMVDWGGDSIRKIDDRLYRNNDYLDYINKNENKYNVVTHNFSQLRCSAGKYYGFIITQDAHINKCARISYNASNIEAENINNFGYISDGGKLIYEEYKNAQFIGLPKIMDKCNSCCWLPTCLITTCPYRVARGINIDCKLVNEKEIKNIEDYIILQYKKGNYKNLM